MGSSLDGLVRTKVADWRERAKDEHESSVWQRKEGHMNDEEYVSAGSRSFQLTECADELEVVAEAALAQGSASTVEGQVFEADGVTWTRWKWQEVSKYWNEQCVTAWAQRDAAWQRIEELEREAAQGSAGAQCTHCSQPMTNEMRFCSRCWNDLAIKDTVAQAKIRKLVNPPPKKTEKSFEDKLTDAVREGVRQYHEE